MELRDQLQSIGHVAELSRLLDVLRQAPRPLGLRELVDLTRKTSGLTHRYPEPEAAHSLAVTLGLVTYRRRRVTITAAGKSFLARQSDITSLSSDQGLLLVKLLKGDEGFANELATLTRSLRRGEDGRYSVAVEGVPPELRDGIVVRALQQCRVLEYVDGLFVLMTDLSAVTSDDRSLPHKLSQKDLDLLLEKRKLMAEGAEEFALQVEQQRLRDADRPDLARYVVRISPDDVEAGYDILSFETDESERFIEVKSSTGGALRFIWSLNERRFATAQRNRYWLYFVPYADVLNDRPSLVHCIQNPIRQIKIGKLIEEPASYLVHANNRAGEPLASIISEEELRYRLWP